MFFKDREDTNIDNDFKNNDNNKLKKFLFNNKVVLCIILFVIIFIICFLIFFNNKNYENFKLNLIGEDIVTIYQGDDYIEPGYKAFNSKNENFNDKVKVNSNLNVKLVGEYEISYKIGNIVKTRKIIVVEKTQDNTFIRLNTINNIVNVYLKVGEKYIEPGFKVYSSTGEDFNNQVKVIGEVNTSKAGKYQLIYSLVNSDGVTITKSRMVIVMDTDIKLSLNTNEYTNKDIIIKIDIYDEYFDYMILPDGSKINKSNYSYKVSENGTYTFKTYNKKGLNKEKSIKVTNIDRLNPTGSCSGSYKNSESTINVNASDNVGIAKYVIDGIEYTENKIHINKKSKNINIIIYDKAGNTKNISCNLKAAEIKNIIYLIGDGMGFNHLEKTKLERNTKLVIDSFVFIGESRTRSLSSSVTDSAAAGTALATGSRTGNGIIGAYYNDINMKKSYPKNLTELCKEKGMLTGVTTTDVTSGATPAAFSAHSSSRSNTSDITYDQLASGINLIWGEANGVVTKAIAQKKGYEYITNYNEMMALKAGSYSFAQFTNSLWMLEPAKNTPNLEQMALKAVDLLDDTDKGFFLMIEGAHIDKHSHNNDGNNMTEAMLEFDKTIEAMLKYAKINGETLVVVTADHETGGITLANGSYIYKTDSHSAANVPVRVYGYDNFISKNEVIDNYEIPIRIARVLGFGEDKFPMSVRVGWDKKINLVLWVDWLLMQVIDNLKVNIDKEKTMLQQ